MLYCYLQYIVVALAKLDQDLETSKQILKALLWTHLFNCSMVY